MGTALQERKEGYSDAEQIASTSCRMQPCSWCVLVNLLNVPS